MDDRCAAPIGSQPRASGWSFGAERELPTLPSADARLDALTASLTVRLGAVCRDWDAAMFAALVQRIAHTQLRWADRERGH